MHDGRGTGSFMREARDYLVSQNGPKSHAPAMHEAGFCVTVIGWVELAGVADAAVERRRSVRSRS